MNAITEIDKLLQGVMDRNELPGVVAAVADETHVAYDREFGNIDVANKVDMPRDAIFQIISMTKPVTTTAIVMLYEEGKLDLDDLISRYFPSLGDLQLNPGCTPLVPGNPCAPYCNESGPGPTGPTTYLEGV